MEKETLWLPNGYKAGTVIYDKNKDSYMATKKVDCGTNIFEIEKVDKNIATQMIQQGSQVLISK